ncbi:MAG: trypsin-like peptidase domain-containing protein [gamma proteobacterium symbiont of Bathyaustriella thionipta]|nr:trypsin-like peptidase domain-containing protein [gamma proteobacterium symbiont of Bathyaustriella thionipta]
MQNHTIKTFLLSIVAGLLAAAALLWLFPGLNFNDKLNRQPVSWADSVSKAAPSVVNIFSGKLESVENPITAQDVLRHQLFGQPLQTQREQLVTNLGSGVIIRSDGLLLTNNHIIAQAEQVKVVLADGRNVPVRLIGTDPETDLALLQIQADNLSVARFADNKNLRVGDVVMAIGNPFGVGQTVTQGIVGGEGRNSLGINTFENFIQTDAAINPGNSGGALINAYGEVVGINAAIVSKSGGSQGIGFAIPIDLALQVVEALLKDGHVVRGWIGIRGIPVTPDIQKSQQLAVDHGILITAINRAGSAYAAGLRAGDVITRVDDLQPQIGQGLLDWLSQKKPGETINITYYRDDKSASTKTQVEERPIPSSAL